MKNICFIVSHLGSGSSDLVDILNKNPQCSIIQSKISYKNLFSLYGMLNMDHKRRDASAVYGDHILYNMSISSKCFYDFCKFIYVVRQPRPALNEIIKKYDYSQKNAKNYYCFRLRRIYEMSRKTKNSIFLSWEDLSKGSSFDLIEKHLDLDTKLNVELHHFNEEYQDSFDENLIEQAQKTYEKYYFYLKREKI